MLKTIIEEYLQRAIVPLLEGNELRGHELAIVAVIKTPHSKEDDSVLVVYPSRTDTMRRFVRYATDKCVLAYRHERSTREIIQLTPHLLEDGDIIYPGGVFERGVAVGVSGVDDWDDEAFALQIASEIRRVGMKLHQNTILKNASHVGIQWR